MAEGMADLTKDYPNISAFMRDEMDRFKDGSGYSGPWVIGWAHCVLCGAVNVVAIPVSDNHPLDVPMECASCGQTEVEFFYEQEEEDAEESDEEAG